MFNSVGLSDSAIVILELPKRPPPEKKRHGLIKQCGGMDMVSEEMASGVLRAQNPLNRKAVEWEIEARGLDVSADEIMAWAMFLLDKKYTNCGTSWTIDSYLWETLPEYGAMRDLIAIETVGRTEYKRRKEAYEKENPDQEEKKNPMDSERFMRWAFRGGNHDEKRIETADDKRARGLARRHLQRHPDRHLPESTASGLGEY